MLILNIEIFDQRIFSFYIWEKLIYNSNKNKNKSATHYINRGRGPPSKTPWVATYSVILRRSVTNIAV